MKCSSIAISATSLRTMTLKNEFQHFGVWSDLNFPACLGLSNPYPHYVDALDCAHAVALIFRTMSIL